MARLARFSKNNTITHNAILRAGSERLVWPCWIPSALRAMQSPPVVQLLRAISRLLGWIYTLSWSLSFYPQPILNLRRRSTTGTTPAFPILNVLGFTSYSISTITFYSSSTIQQQYSARHHGGVNTVRGNDIAFAVHALVLSLVTLSQFWSTLWGFEERKWRVGNGVWGIMAGCCIGVVWTMGMAISSGSPGWEWIDVVGPRMQNSTFFRRPHCGLTSYS